MTTSNYREIARREKLPIDYEIFKGIGGKFGKLTLKLKKAYTNDPNEKKGTGIVCLLLTPTIDKNQYDYEKQIKINLGLTDIGKIIYFLRNPECHEKDNNNNYICKIVHDRGSYTNKDSRQDLTYLNITKAEDKTNYFFSATKQVDRQTIASVSLPVAPDEIIILGTLLQQAIPLILAWWSDFPVK